MPMRPSLGALIVVYSSCVCAVSITASFAAIAPSTDPPWLVADHALLGAEVSACQGFGTDKVLLCRDEHAASCARLALARSRAAWNKRGSIVAITSPFLTFWPSVNSTDFNLPSAWAWIRTVDDACTVPRPSRGFVGPVE